MNLFFKIIFFCLLGSNLYAQPFDKAPETSKKVKTIIEWIRPNLDVKSTKGMVSTFDQKGNLISYRSKEDQSIFNTFYVLDKQNRVLESREGEGVNSFKTRYTYKQDRTIKETRFRGKLNRTIDFLDKKGKVIERKQYSKGLELGNNFQLRERIILQYNKRGQLSSERILSYNLPNSNKFSTRKTVYHYDANFYEVIKIVEYDYDETVSVVKDFAYYKDRKLKSIITNYFKDKTVAFEEYLYQKGKIWQKISSEQGIRHVEIYTDGRLIRLRSYNNDKIYRVVDYQYGYF